MASLRNSAAPPITSRRKTAYKPLMWLAILLSAIAMTVIVGVRYLIVSGAFAAAGRATGGDQDEGRGSSSHANRSG